MAHFRILAARVREWHRDDHYIARRFISGLEFHTILHFAPASMFIRQISALTTIILMAEYADGGLGERLMSEGMPGDAIIDYDWHYRLPALFCALISP